MSLFRSLKSCKPMESAAFVLCVPNEAHFISSPPPVTWWGPLPALHCEILPDYSHCSVYLSLVTGKQSLKRSRVKKQYCSFLERKIH